MKYIVTTFVLSLALLGVGCVQRTATVAPTAALPAERAAKPSGVSLDYSGRGLREAPKEIFQRDDVVSLDLSDNELEGALPAEIRLMRSLEVLDVSGNRMTGLPAEIGQLNELRVLDVSNNQLTGLPLELGNLQKLELLDLSGNAYSDSDLSKIQSALSKKTVIRR